MNRPGRADTDAHILLDGVSHSFRKTNADAPVQALQDISIALRRHSFTALLGPSGCGKTTLLRLVAGLIEPDSGQILIGGNPPVPGRQSSFVFQSFRLIPWKTAQANIEFALLQSIPSRDERHQRARFYLDLVGLAKFADAYPGELSGGMRQRVALARALACETEILLMDEPFASLDAQARELMQDELLYFWEKTNASVIFVTHSVDEALRLADRIVLMGPRPGRILETFPVEFPGPRWKEDVRSLPEFVRLRHHLWERLRDLVLSDPESDFHGRDLSRRRLGE